MDKTVRYLVTGGCGFIGTSLITQLNKANPKPAIRVLDNLTGGTRDDLAEVCEFVEKEPPLDSVYSSSLVELVSGDIKDMDTCRECCRDVDVVVHLAANTGVGPSVDDPRKDMETNVMGTFNMLEASREAKVNKFIFASSGAPIGEVDSPISEKKAPKPVSPYGASKLGGEGYCSAYYRTFGLKTVALRFGNVYGPGSKHKGSVVAKFYRQALNGETLEIYGDGKQTRDFIYIEDLILAIQLSVKADTGGEVFQIATYMETTVNEISEKIKSIVEKETGSKIGIVYAAPRRGDVKRNYSDIIKARNILGFEPAYDLNKGLNATFNYFKNSLSNL